MNCFQRNLNHISKPENLNIEPGFNYSFRAEKISEKLAPMIEIVTEDCHVLEFYWSVSEPGSWCKIFQSTIKFEERKKPAKKLLV